MGPEQDSPSVKIDTVRSAGAPFAVLLDRCWAACCSDMGYAQQMNAFAAAPAFQLSRRDANGCPWARAPALRHCEAIRAGRSGGL